MVRFYIALSIHLLVGMAGVCAAGTVAVRSDKGMLWLDSRAAPAPEVFTAIARETEIRFIVDEELHPVAVNLKLEGVEIERAIRNLVGEVGAVGYGMSYQSLPAGGAKLTEVAIYGAGGRSAKGTVYEASRPPLPSILAPNHEEAAASLKASGIVPAESVDRVIALSRELEAERGKIGAGPHDRSELAPDSATVLDRLLAKGMSMEEAVRALLIQEKERRVMREIATVPGGPGVFETLRRRSYIDYGE
jgi:hypothetical protein